MHFTVNTFKRRISEGLASVKVAGHPVHNEPQIGDTEVVIDLSEIWLAKDNEHFLHQAYQRILGRKPDISGLVHHLELLRNHVSRQIVVHQIIHSEEARRRGCRYTGIREVTEKGLKFRGLRGLRSAYQSIVARTREVIRLVFHARLDVIDHKIDYILQELASNSDRLSVKVDQACWTLSEKLDRYVADLNSLHMELGSQILTAINRQNAAETSERLAQLFRLIEQHNTLYATSSTVLSKKLDAIKLDAIRTEEISILTHSLADLNRRFTELCNQVAVLSMNSTEHIEEVSQELIRLFSLVERQETAYGNQVKQLQAVLENQQADAAKALDRVRGDLMNRTAEFSDRQTHFEAYYATLSERQQADSRTSIDSLRETLRSELRELRNRTRPPVLHGGNNVLITEVDDFIIGVPGEEWRLAAFHAFRGMLEPGLIRRFRSVIKSGMTVIDVGAHVGAYTLCAARSVGPTGKVYSYEPTPRTFEILKDNIQINGFLESGVIVLRHAAVFDRRGTADLHIHPQNSGHNTLFSGNATLPSISTETVALDEEIPISRVDVVKIDAEGAEPFVLRGMKGIIANNPDIHIFIEFACQHLMRSATDPREFLKEIESLGLIIMRVNDTDGSLHPAPIDELISSFSVNLELTRRHGETR